MAIEVARLRPPEHAQWQDFLARTATGTLFHDLDFLAYHPDGRHDFHHLIFREDGRIVALLPGGILADEAGRVFTSPLGASTGGFAALADLRLGTAMALVEALVAHARGAGWARLDITLAPSIHHGPLAQLPAFALTRAGAQIADRKLCLAIRLPTGPGETFARRFRATAANRVRAARRAGTVVRRLATPERFAPLLAQTYARHGATPTHGPAELADLCRRVPGRLAFHIAEQEGEDTGGVCVFRLSPRVATTVYICPSATHPKAGGVLAAIADAMEQLAGDGVEWLDLGPSADHGSVNHGVVSFKESLGAEYHLRERLLLLTPH